MHVLDLLDRSVAVCAVVVHPEIIGRVAGDFAHEIRDPRVARVIARAGRADELVALVPQRDHLAVPGVSGLLRRDAGALGLVEVVDYAVVGGADGGPVLTGELAEVVDHGAEGGAVLELGGGPGVPVAEGVEGAGEVDLVEAGGAVGGVGVVPEEAAFLGHLGRGSVGGCVSERC